MVPAARISVAPGATAGASWFGPTAELDEATFDELFAGNVPDKDGTAVARFKAAGGIRDLDALLAMRAIGVSRVGATRTESMLEDCRKRLGLEPIARTIPATAPAGY